MEALTLYNPHAILVALDEKRNETRSRPTKYRGPLAIHAGAFQGWKDLIREEPFRSVLAKHGYMTWKDLPFGAIVAICNLTDCRIIGQRVQVGQTNEPKGMVLLGSNNNDPIYVNGNELAFGDYTIGRFAWLLKDIHPLKTPIPAKGKQGIWKWDTTPHLVTIDPFMIGQTKIWTPKGIRQGKIVNPDREDAVSGLEVA